VRLNIRETGEGDRVAVLIHGFNCDSGDWWELTPVLIKAGYRVQAVDLRGHGHSPRAESYRLADFASDLVDTIMPASELIVGHSLGARVAGLAVAALAPSRVVYLDPPWSPIDRIAREGLFPDLDSIARTTDDDLASMLHANFPRWSDRAIAVDVASWRLWDPRTAEWIDEATTSSVPEAPAAPSLVVVADPSPVCGALEQLIARERGFEVRTAEGLSHSLFRDDFSSFLGTLDGWL